ncbi:flagellar basal-body rod modification protein FlgD [Anoxybacillus vitaminiphilus]|uniref:Flagellar basal-body rod modification protein FlgD n=1 Tax=Paranoxybacillus vitaminiphilus TaxID=581036 RepID=A0A327YQF3_9BACL|nr:flagellar hook assembly protein FlgD [Anoxybacillus vitaminiphilus]RAK23374.1 flagellar basal-body rod modification protein FlgD [Anoxybacillus vitaminiphilus]
MANNTIDPSLYLSNYTPPERKTGQQSLGKDDFLKILLTQLQHQDPLNPLEDKEFISQMASFSTLEQMTNLTKTMEKFVESQNAHLILRYSEMIGKQVEWKEETVSESGETVQDTKQGMVKAVRQKDGEIALELENGQLISANVVTKITIPNV